MGTNVVPRPRSLGHVPDEDPHLTTIISAHRYASDVARVGTAVLDGGRRRRPIRPVVGQRPAALVELALVALGAVGHAVGQAVEQRVAPRAGAGFLALGGLPAGAEHVGAQARVRAA